MRGLPVLLLAAALHAGEFDADTLEGMDAEVAGDWARAVLAFDRADAARAPGASARLRYARTRGIEFWQREVKALLAEELFPEAAQAVALARLVQPNHSIVSGTIAKLERKGIAVPEIPAAAAQPGAFPGRSPAGKVLCWGALGAAAMRADRIAQGCLDFLVKTQSEVGAWDSDKFGGGALYDPGVTALALLALLSEGAEGLTGPRGEAARRARTYLVGRQTDDGAFGTKESQHFQYNCFLAAEALAEYAVIRGETAELRSVLEKARDWIVSAQNPRSGWRYEPRGSENDTSLTCLAVCALDRLSRAGVQVPPDAIEGAASWIDSMTDKQYGQIGYNMQGGMPARPEGFQNTFPPEHTQAMTAAGSLAWIYCGRPPSAVSRSLGLIVQVAPVARYADFYYWHYGARVQVACTAAVDPDWYAAMVAACGELVNKDGGIDARDAWSSDGGRIYATGMCVLALAAPHREPPQPSAQRLSASAFLRYGERVVAVAGAIPVATGIYLDPAVRVEARVRGTLELARGLAKVGPEGNSEAKFLERPLKSAPFGCLLARVGPEGKPFRIEGEKPFGTKTPGQLYLLPNDAQPADDGEGGWTVTVRLVE